MYSLEEKSFSAYLSSPIVSNLKEEINFFNAIETKDLCQIFNFTLNKEKSNVFPSFFTEVSIIREWSKNIFYFYFFVTLQILELLREQWIMKEIHNE